jgi:hypothetical protein
VQAAYPEWGTGGVSNLLFDCVLRSLGFTLLVQPHSFQRIAAYLVWLKSWKIGANAIVTVVRIVVVERAVGVDIADIVGVRGIRGTE